MREQVSVEEASRRLGVTPTTVYNRVRRGDLQAADVKQGKIVAVWLEVPDGEVEPFIPDSHPEPIAVEEVPVPIPSGADSDTVVAGVFKDLMESPKAEGGLFAPQPTDADRRLEQYRLARGELVRVMEIIIRVGTLYPHQEIMDAVNDLAPEIPQLKTQVQLDWFQRRLASVRQLNSLEKALVGVARDYLKTADITIDDAVFAPEATSLDRVAKAMADQLERTMQGRAGFSA